MTTDPSEGFIDEDPMPVVCTGRRTHPLTFLGDFGIDDEGALHLGATEWRVFATSEREWEQLRNQTGYAPHGDKPRSIREHTDEAMRLADHIFGAFWPRRRRIVRNGP